MKYFYFLFAAVVLFTACSKDDNFDPSKPEDGEEVELFLDHYTTGSNKGIYLSTNRDEPIYTYIEHFDEREIGYTYIVKAKVKTLPEGVMDAPSYWFVYEQTIRKDKYQGQDTITLPLFGAISPFNALSLRKEGDAFYYSGYALRATDDAVAEDMEAALAKGQEIMMNYRPNTMALYVQHDEENYGKGYVVYRVGLE